MEKELLKSLKLQVSVFRFLDYRDFLAALYAAAKKAQTTYSYLKFAADLGFSETNVIRLVIARKRRLSRKSARTLCDALRFDNRERAYFFALVDCLSVAPGPRKEALFEKALRMQHEEMAETAASGILEYFSSWHHVVIRELVGLADFSPEADWINGRLLQHISPREIAASLKLLEGLGFIAFNQEKNRWVQTDKTVSTPMEVRGVGLRRFHREILELTREAFDHTKAADRTVHAVTVRLPHERAMKLKLEIQEFVSRILAMEQEAGADDEIFQVNLHLFPITSDRKRK